MWPQRKNSQHDIKWYDRDQNTENMNDVEEHISRWDMAKENNIWVWEHHSLHSKTPEFETKAEIRKEIEYDPRTIVQT